MSTDKQVRNLGIAIEGLEEIIQYWHGQTCEGETPCPFDNCNPVCTAHRTLKAMDK